MEEDEEEGWQYGTYKGSFTGTFQGSFTGKFKLGTSSRHPRSRVRPNLNIDPVSRVIPTVGSELIIPGRPLGDMPFPAIPGALGETHFQEEEPTLSNPSSIHRRFPTPNIDLSRLVQIGADVPVEPYQPSTREPLPREAWLERPAPVTSNPVQAMSPIVPEVDLSPRKTFSADQRRLEERILGIRDLFTSDDDNYTIDYRHQRQREHRRRPEEQAVDEEEAKHLLDDDEEEDIDSDDDSYIPPSSRSEMPSSSLEDEVHVGQAEDREVRGRSASECDARDLSNPNETVQAQPQIDVPNPTTGISRSRGRSSHGRRDGRKPGFASPGGDRGTEDPRRSLLPDHTLNSGTEDPRRSLLPEDAESPHLTSRSDVTSSRSEVKVEQDTETRHQRRTGERERQQEQSLPRLLLHPRPSPKDALDLWKTAARCAQDDFERTRSISAETMLAIARNQIRKLTRPD
jgi:hypothetical protein